VWRARCGALDRAAACKRFCRLVILDSPSYPSRVAVAWELLSPQRAAGIWGRHAQRSLLPR
jgi:hypothetical protein